MRFGEDDDLVSRVAVAVERLRRKFLLLHSNMSKGIWCGELEADTTLNSDYFCCTTLTGTGNPERVSRKAARYILKYQNAMGHGVFFRVARRILALGQIILWVEAGGI